MGQLIFNEVAAANPVRDYFTEKNVTTLMVTHDVDEAIYLSDRVLIMSRTMVDLGDIKVDLLRPRDRNCEQYHSYMKQR